jgi:hypothetical protein
MLITNTDSFAGIDQLMRNLHYAVISYKLCITG